MNEEEIPKSDRKDTGIPYEEAYKIVRQYIIDKEGITVGWPDDSRIEYTGTNKSYAFIFRGGEIRGTFVVDNRGNVRKKREDIDK